MNEKSKKILEEQLELLSEISHAKETNFQEIILCSQAIALLIAVLRNNQTFDVEKFRNAFASEMTLISHHKAQTAL